MSGYLTQEFFLEVNHKKNNVDCRFIDKQTAYNTPGFKEIYDTLEENNRPSVAFLILVVLNITDCKIY